MDRVKEFRRKNKSYRNSCRKRNYHRGRPALEKKKRRPSGVASKPWDELDISVIRNSGCSDRSLAEILGRSVQAIQQKRYQLKKDGKS